MAGDGGALNSHKHRTDEKHMKGIETQNDRAALKGKIYQIGVIKGGSTDIDT